MPPSVGDVDFLESQAAKSQMVGSMTDSDIFASKPFTFIVEGKPLYVHAALVADCSEPLDRMINGHLSEAQQGFAVLNEVDQETFLGFIRWTYCKDYPARTHVMIESDDSVPNVDLRSAKGLLGDDDWMWGSFSKKDKKKKKKKVAEPHMENMLRESFISEHEGVDLPGSLIPPARPNRGPDEDYTPVLLGHARMYVFAEKYDIRELKSLALQKLKHQLAIHTLYIERVGEIIALLKYVYANTTESANDATDIRAMLAQYVGVEMVTLLTYGDIKELMLEDGEILGDFLKMFAVRINSMMVSRDL